MKAEITEKVKSGKTSVSQVAKENGLAETTIYGWFSTKAKDEPGTLELARLKRENLSLARIVGIYFLPNQSYVLDG